MPPTVRNAFGAPAARKDSSAVRLKLEGAARLGAGGVETLAVPFGP